MSLSFKIINRGFSSSAQMRAAIKNVTVVGGGLMGSGIAQVQLLHISDRIHNIIVNNEFSTVVYS